MLMNFISEGLAVFSPLEGGKRLLNLTRGATFSILTEISGNQRGFAELRSQKRRELSLQPNK